jgi:lysophospholipase L1-like esterase
MGGLRREVKIQIYTKKAQQSTHNISGMDSMMKMMTSKWLVYSLCGALAVAITSFGFYVVLERSDARPFERQCSKPILNGDAYIVSAIGDSWIAGGKLDSGFGRGLAKLGVDATVKTTGHPGARSKLIYQNLESWVGWIEQSYPKLKKIYVIEGGINDALAYVGKDFYVKHVKLAVDAATACGEKAVVLSIPTFDRDKGNRSFITNARWAVYRWISGDKINENVNEYNRALRQELAATMQSGRVKIIDLDEILGQDAFKVSSVDGVHLSPLAYDEMAYKIGIQLGEFAKRE